MKQVPLSDLRKFNFENDPEACAETLLPIVETLFQLPGRGPPKGSKSWIASLVRSPKNATYENMVSYPEILDAYIKDQENNHSDKDKVIILRAGESTHLNDVYQISESVRDPQVQSSSYRSCEHLPFLRKVSHLYAIKQVRQANRYPVQIRADDMPNLTAWNNFSQVLRKHP